jgi:hypothetical protein
VRTVRGSAPTSSLRRLALLVAAILVVDVVAAAAVFVDRRDDPLVPDFVRLSSAAIDWDVDTYRDAAPVLRLSVELPESARLEGGHVRFVKGPDSPDLLLRFAMGALQKAEEEDNPRWRRLAVNAVDQVLATAQGGMVPHDYEVIDARGRTIEKGWYAAETQGLLLSTLARLYEVTGDTRWRTVSDEVFGGLSSFRGFFAGSKPAPVNWITSVDDEGYLWFDRFSTGLESSYILGEQAWAALGVYDYRRVLATGAKERRAAARLFTGSVATMRDHLRMYRVPGRIWVDSLVAGNRSVRAHFAAKAQLDLLVRITGDAVLARYDRLLDLDDNVPFFVVKPLRASAGGDPYDPLPPGLSVSLGATRPAAVTSRGTPTAGPGLEDPTRDATFAIGALARYRHGEGRVWLQRARAAVDAALRESRDGVLTYSYRQKNVFGEQLRRPWASAQGQGLLLSALVRLYRADGDPERLEQARAVFKGLTRVRDYGYPPPRPWLGFIDYSGYLWFEQYADGGQPSQVLTGHLAAVIGLYDFWSLTGDGIAYSYFAGGLSTLRDALPLIRQPGGYARSSLARDGIDPRSHPVLAQQVAGLARVTSDRVLERYARLLARDYARVQANERCYADVRCSRLFEQ